MARYRGSLCLIAALVFGGIASLQAVAQTGTVQAADEHETGIEALRRAYAAKPTPPHRWAVPLPSSDGDIFYVDLNSIALAADRQTVSALIYMKVSPGKAFHREGLAVITFDCGVRNDGSFSGVSGYLINGVGPLPLGGPGPSAAALAAERVCGVARCRIEQEDPAYRHLLAGGSCTADIATYPEIK